MQSDTVSKKLFLAVSGLAVIGLLLAACSRAGLDGVPVYWYQAIPTPITSKGDAPTPDQLKEAVSQARTHADSSVPYVISLFYQDSPGAKPKCETTSNTNGTLLPCGDNVPVPPNPEAMHVAQLVFFSSSQEETDFKKALFK